MLVQSFQFRESQWNFHQPAQVVALFVACIYETNSEIIISSSKELKQCTTAMRRNMNWKVRSIDLCNLCFLLVGCAIVFLGYHFSLSTWHCIYCPKFTWATRECINFYQMKYFSDQSSHCLRSKFSEAQIYFKGPKLLQFMRNEQDHSDNKAFSQNLVRQHFWKFFVADVYSSLRRETFPWKEHAEIKTEAWNPHFTQHWVHLVQKNKLVNFHFNYVLALLLNWADVFEKLPFLLITIFLCTENATDHRMQKRCEWNNRDSRRLKPWLILQDKEVREAKKLATEIFIRLMKKWQGYNVAEIPPDSMVVSRCCLLLTAARWVFSSIM